MDSKNTKSNIVDLLYDDVKSEKLTMAVNDKKIEDETEIKKQLTAFVDETVDRLHRNAVLKVK